MNDNGGGRKSTPTKRALKKLVPKIYPELKKKKKEPLVWLGGGKPSKAGLGWLHGNQKGRVATER